MSLQNPFVIFLAIMLCLFNYTCLAQPCDEFVSWVAPVKDQYQSQHRIYPVPRNWQDIAVQYMPRLWVHPDSWQPIYFEDYLQQAKLVSLQDQRIISVSPLPTEVARLSHEQQCQSYFIADEVKPRETAPAYIHVYWDESPLNRSKQWTYIKYNFVFDWSGLAEERSWASTAGAWLVGDSERWHRLDIHVAAILAFDEQQRFRLLTLAQHNHQQTFLPGIDFPDNKQPSLVAAFRSNELYLDNGNSEPVYHRVVPFFTDVAFLIDPEQRPMFWAIDKVYGRNAGAREVLLEPRFLQPKHPLADFAGLLAPPNRTLGFYTGQDGPPGYNYYAMPEAISLTNFAALGFWKPGDKELLGLIGPLIDGFENTQWQRIIEIMKKRLGVALQNQ